MTEKFEVLENFNNNNNNIESLKELSEGPTYSFDNEYYPCGLFKKNSFSQDDDGLDNQVVEFKDVQIDGEENHSVKQKKKKHKGNSQIVVKIPGETKNLSKCFARQLQQFIKNTIKNSDDSELKKTLENNVIKKFLEENPEEIGKAKLLIFMNTSIGQIFCKEFFGNCQWNYRLIKESKINIELCFRYNISYYQEVIKKIQKIDQN
ncbi:unnamed protein product [Paramecium sonneborni]|uniref:Uncharacterized protein n=1 Tax=Paramecium sonneborni TaxID=65129 RepID=A0A8S1R0I9_9CILI|nr:unnamed protein product [Paramecium sonneborni]